MVASGSYFVNVKNLPVEQLAKAELAVPFETAKALGVTIPQSVTVQVEEVIQ
jgi:hypothetical protein